jgi:hypothetical protein
MLTELLNQIHSGKPRSSRELAASLNVPEPVLYAMIDQLVKLGYLEQYGGDGCDDDACKSCAAGGCMLTGGQRIWLISDKGRKTLEQSLTHS